MINIVLNFGKRQENHKYNYLVKCERTLKNKANSYRFQEAVSVLSTLCYPTLGTTIKTRKQGNNENCESFLSI